MKRQIALVLTIAIFAAMLLSACTAAIKESAPSTTTPSSASMPSTNPTPAPSPTPRVLLEYGACGAYEVFAPSDSPEVCVSMDGAEYMFDLTGVLPPDEPRRLYLVGGMKPSENVSETVYSLYRFDSSVTTNHVDMWYSVLVSSSEQAAFISELLASAEFQPISADELSWENRLRLYAETVSGLVEYQIGVDGLLLRLSEPFLTAKSEITYEAAEIGTEAAAYLHLIEWANRSFPTSCRNDWKCFDDPEPTDYRMCIVGEELHLHLTVDEAKEFAKSLDPDNPQSRDTLSTSKLGWSGYDGYIIVDEYVPGFSDPADLASRHVLFRDGSVASRLYTHSAVVHYAGANSTVIAFDSNFPRAANLSDAGAVDYDAALAWIASRG